MTKTNIWMILKMDEKELRSKFTHQKSMAKRRGIAWELTFKDWVDWWGDDIERRGVGSCNLQMQRFADTGPYALGNIKKGYPRDNSATWSRTFRNRKANKAKAEHEAWLDALMFAASSPPEDEIEGENYEKEMMESPAVFAAFTIDKSR